MADVKKIYDDLIIINLYIFGIFVKACCELENSMRDTPLRLLIKMFPELAKKVFDQCTETNLQQYADRDEGKEILEQDLYSSHLSAATIFLGIIYP